MKIAILGTRGIPNHYGGFEQVSSWLAAGLVAKGHEVFVYNSHNHPYREASWKGVNIIHCYDPEYLLGTAGQFVYDLNCILDARKRNFDLLLFMGYTSSSVWFWLFPEKPVIVSNMDGLEWKRAKYSKPVRRFLRYAEALAIRHSDFHIADSKAIQEYIEKTYGTNCCYIPYAAETGQNKTTATMQLGGLEPGRYVMLMARMEPENHIEMILEGFSTSRSEGSCIVIGNTHNHYGRRMKKKFAGDQRIRFAGGLFDQDLLHTLRKNCRLYFHGHSVGGTNPSLLEAMASQSPVAAHDNIFNRSVLGDDALYFTTADEIRQLVETNQPQEVLNRMTANNFLKIKETYNRQLIVDQYENFLASCFETSKNAKAISDKRYAYK